MSIDQRIKEELQSEAKYLDDILAQEPGLFNMLFGVFKGSMKRWAIFVNIVVLVLTVILVWTGYNFFIAPNTDARIFWGVISLAIFMIHIALKQWLFAEMRRTSLMREVKRLELSVVNLMSKL